jgi:hypothetical protein
MNININDYPTNGVYSLRLFKSRGEVGLPSGGGFSPDPDLPIYRRIRDRTFQMAEGGLCPFVFIWGSILFRIYVYSVGFNSIQRGDMV